VDAAIPGHCPVAAQETHGQEDSAPLECLPNNAPSLSIMAMVAFAPVSPAGHPLHTCLNVRPFYFASLEGSGGVFLR